MHLSMMSQVVYLLTLLAVCMFLGWTEGATKPNIIYIMGDDVGWNDVGFHNPKVKTPNIDALLKVGIKLSNNYAAPLCSASRSALMTGRYPIHNGFQHMVFAVQAPSCLPLEHKLLPEYMKDEGYVTKMLGKWHLGYCTEECLPRQRGWDEFRGILGGESDYYTWEEDGVVLKYINNTVNTPSKIDPIHLSIQDKVDVRDMIMAHTGNTDPLFMIVSPNAPHSPFEVTDSMYNVHSNLELDPSNPDQDARRKYLGLVSALDDIVGETMQALRDSDLLTNSVIVFQSDNGGSNIRGGHGECYGNNYPLRNGKTSPYEGGIKVPTIYVDHRLPAFTQGTERNFMMHITDWLPTFLDLAGGTTEASHIDGVSQISNLGYVYRPFHKYTVRDRFLVNMDTVSTDKEVYKCTDRDSAFRYKDWKLVYGEKTTWSGPEDTPDTYRKPEESPELPTITGDSCVSPDGQIRCLFNLKYDPSEQHNLYDSKPKIVEKLLAMINELKPTIVREVYEEEVEICDSNTIAIDEIYVPRIPQCVTSNFKLQPNYPECNQDFNTEQREEL